MGKQVKQKKTKYLDGLKVLGKATFTDWYKKEPSPLLKQLPAYVEADFLAKWEAATDDQAKRLCLYEYLYQDVNAYLFSNEDKKQRGDKEERIYGEVCVESIQSLMADINQIFIPFTKQARINFYEIGSGGGRAIVLASLLGSFYHCYGYEYYGHLFELSTYIRKRLLMCLHSLHMTKQFTPIDFIQENLYKIDLRNDLQNHVIWINYPIHKIEFYRSFNNVCRHLGGRLLIASVIQELRPAHTRQVAVRKYKFDWGESEVYFYLRK